ncbi:hypothetical protein [Amycolatopsis sp. NPDC059657]|uniref:hypothetical protein n=1 Tax=Amycolatopsis sp. NPDC059657 TaxID=3346899 RepID=UPI00366FEDF5
MFARALATVLTLVFALLGVMATPSGALTGWALAALAAGVVVWQAPPQARRWVKTRAPGVVIGVAVFVGSLAIMGMVAVLGAAVTGWLLVIAASAAAARFRWRRVS